VMATNLYEMFLFEPPRAEQRRTKTLRDPRDKHGLHISIY